MKRKPIAAANWKMNSAPEGWESETSPYRPRKDIDVIVFPALPDIAACVEQSLNVGAQAARPEPSGAFTGDVNMDMVTEMGCTYVLCGHSERRINYQETDEFVAAQAKAAQADTIVPIICIGETLEQREAGAAESTVESQLKPVLDAGITDGDFIIAYEPVWAIGTGKTASPEDAQTMHAFIRALMPDGQHARIIYGGSVKPENADALIAQKDIDGFLVGGASLKADSFASIVDSCAVKG